MPTLFSPLTLPPLPHPILSQPSPSHLKSPTHTHTPDHALTHPSLPNTQHQLNPPSNAPTPGHSRLQTHPYPAHLAISQNQSISMIQSSHLPPLQPPTLHSILAYPSSAAFHVSFHRQFSCSLSFSDSFIPLLHLGNEFSFNPFSSCATFVRHPSLHTGCF